MECKYTQNFPRTCKSNTFKLIDQLSKLISWNCLFLCINKLFKLKFIGFCGDQSVIENQSSPASRCESQYGTI